MMMYLKIIVVCTPIIPHCGTNQKFKNVQGNTGIYYSSIAVYNPINVKEIKPTKI